MAKLDAKSVQSAFIANDTVGKALGYALPVLFQYPPSSPEAITETMTALNDLYEKLFSAATVEKRPPLEATFINAIMDGMNAWRKGNSH